jgi:hypothetical protein
MGPTLHFGRLDQVPVGVYDVVVSNESEQLWTFELDAANYRSLALGFPPDSGKIHLDFSEATGDRTGHFCQLDGTEAWQLGPNETYVMVAHFCFYEATQPFDHLLLVCIILWVAIIVIGLAVLGVVLCQQRRRDMTVAYFDDKESTPLLRKLLFYLLAGIVILVLLIVNYIGLTLFFFVCGLILVTLLFTLFTTGFLQSS